MAAMQWAWLVRPAVARLLDRPRGHSAKQRVPVSHALLSEERSQGGAQCCTSNARITIGSRPDKMADKRPCFAGLQ